MAVTSVPSAVDEQHAAQLQAAVTLEWTATHGTVGRIAAPYTVGDRVRIRDGAGRAWVVEPVWIGHLGTETVYSRMADGVWEAGPAWRWENRDPVDPFRVMHALSRSCPDLATLQVEPSFVRAYVLGPHDVPPPVPPVLASLLAQRCWP